MPLRAMLTALIASLMTGPATVDAQRMPLPMVNEAPVYDQFRQPLPRATGLIQVLACGGLKYPPNPFSGEPHPENYVLYESVVGAGINPHAARAGFSAFITPRPDLPLFVRVYNALSPGESTFYADSDIFSPSLSLDTVFLPQVTATTNPINPAVTPDGLTVSMKKSLGLNPYAADTDGDGIHDVDELRMGSDARDPASRMPPLVVCLDKSGNMSAFWNSLMADAGLLAATELSVMTQTEIAQIFRAMIYQIEQTDRLGPFPLWTRIPGTRKQVLDQWPPSVSMPQHPEDTRFFRMRIE